MIKAVTQAEEQVIVRIYIFDNDDYAVSLADLLRQQSKNVKIKVLFDDMGTRMAAAVKPTRPVEEGFEYPYSMKQYLRQDSEVKVRTVTNPWFIADHNKTITIDGKRGFIGGMNFGSEYRFDWHDLMVEVKGEIVTVFDKMFHRAWAHAGPTGDLGYMFSYFRQESEAESPEASIDIQTLYTTTGRAQIYRTQLAAINRSQQYIYLQNPYLASAARLGRLPPALLGNLLRVPVLTRLPSRRTDLSDLPSLPMGFMRSVSTDMETFCGTPLRYCYTFRPPLPRGGMGAQVLADRGRLTLCGLCFEPYRELMDTFLDRLAELLTNAD